MKNSLIKVKSVNNNSIIKNYYLALLPVLLFGLYKNIIVLLTNGISFNFIIKPLVFPLIGIILGAVIDSIKNKKVSFGFNSVLGLMLSMIIPVETNIIVLFLSFIILFLLSLFDKNYKFNSLSISKLFIIIVLFLLGKYNYSNVLELKYIYNHTIFDNIIGFNIGGLASTSIIAILIGYFILSFNQTYKKRCSLIALITYLICLILFIFLFGKINLLMLLNSSNLFAIIFIVPFCLYSPYEKKEQYLYSIIIGVIASLVCLTQFYNEAIIIGIIISNIVLTIINTIKKA